MIHTGNDNQSQTMTALPGEAGAPVPSAYPQPIDAIVLAGTHQNPRRLINGCNKCFLQIGERPLVRHVVDALAGAAQVGEIFVVGPVDELAPVLAGAPRVHLVPQEGKMLSNSWAAIRASEAHHGDDGLADARPLLIISSDLPLITPRAVDDFIARCAAQDRAHPPGFALLVGVSEEAALCPYYGNENEAGIRRPLVHLEAGEMRLSNIYVARPRQLAHHEFLQTSFSYRKAKDWRNVLKLVASLFRQHGGWSAAWLTLRLQMASMLSRGRGRLYWKLRRGNTMARVEKGVSTVLGGPVRVVVTPFGGLSLDVDDPEDLAVLSARYREWMAVMEAVGEG